MRGFDKNQKWTLICQSKEGPPASAKTNSAEHYIELLKKDSITLKNAESLRISLGGESMAWLQKFIDMKGIVFLFEKFSQLHELTEYASLLG